MFAGTLSGTTQTLPVAVFTELAQDFDVALAIAALLVIPRELRKYLTPRHLATAVLAFSLGCAPLLVYNTRNPLETFRASLGIARGLARPRGIRHATEGSRDAFPTRSQRQSGRRPEGARNKLALAIVMRHSRADPFGLSDYRAE